MKRIFITVILIVALSIASFARKTVAAGETHTVLGDYVIEQADEPFVLDGEKLKTFIISYKNTPMEVVVAIRKDRNCRKYFVISDILSVQYVCKEQYFGVEKLDRSLKSDGYVTSDAELNKAEYFRQKKLCSGNNGEIENTQLIAAFFPMLIQSAEDVLSSL